MKTQDHLRVLYAEDNEDASEMMTFLLGLSEIDIINAKSVAEAWQLTQAEYFDLYLLDSRFPDGNGLELCRRLRDQFPQTPIIFYSGEARESDRQKGLSAGADAYLVKPNSDNVASVIRQLTERAQYFSESRKNVSKKNGNANLSEYVS
ncbi:hypothetical protein BH20ACI4_BH20ACI4_29850 [soil metagenome]